MGKKLTTETFIEKAKKIHGDTYNYSKVNYVNNRTKICIICPIHGEYWQAPDAHLRGQGCPTCGGTKKLTTQEFIEKARLVHGDKYDYSKVEYVNSATKVCIICPVHGEFWQLPDYHLKSYGCPKCGINIRAKNNTKTTEQFIKEAQQIHGDKYDYSKVKYIGKNKNVCIICPKHGEFWQTPHNHLCGAGCPSCKKEYFSDIYKDTTETFIEKARKIHGDKYDYSKVNYVDSYTKLCIICPEHGEFWQRPNNHLNGWGCAKCGNKLRGKNQTKLQEQFIKDAKQVHGWKYDYSKVEYVNNKTKVCIICPEHGEFWQTPNNHLRGNTCPKCCESKLEQIVEKTLKSSGINFYFQCSSKSEIKNIGRKRLDFYLPEYNVAIECQGEQHFEPIEFFGGKKQFEIQKNSDKEKLQICMENNIYVIYFTKHEYIGKYNLKNGDGYMFCDDENLLTTIIKKIRRP